MKRMFTISSMSEATEKQESFVMSHWQQSSRPSKEEAQKIESFLQEDVKRIMLKRYNGGKDFTGVVVTQNNKEIAICSK